MEGVLLSVGVVAVLVGLGRWWKPPKPGEGSQGGRQYHNQTLSILRSRRMGELAGPSPDADR
jgi:hypothetical protein